MKVIKTLAVLYSLYMVYFKVFKYLPSDMVIYYLAALTILGFFILNLMYQAGQSIPEEDKDLKG